MAFRPPLHHATSAGAPQMLARKGVERQCLAQLSIEEASGAAGRRVRNRRVLGSRQIDGPPMQTALQASG